MLNNIESLFTAYNIPLSLQAGWLIQQGMFDAKGGRCSGLLARYKRALSGTDYKASYVLIPNTGIAILVDGYFNLYVHEELRGKGIAKELVNYFVNNFSELIAKEKFETQEPTTRILNNALKEVKNGQ